jgi:IrrE N-terminal-like domain
MSDWLHGVRVPPLKIRDLRRLAVAIRSHSNLEECAPFPVLRFLEWSMPELIEAFDWEIVESLPDGDEARAYPDGAPHYPQGPVIQMLAHVYDDAAKNRGRPRLTILHECGHVLLHRHVAVHHRGLVGADLPTWENSEWQASQFAVELLMPVPSVETAEDLESYVERMGVSREAACNRAMQLERTLGKPLPPWPVTVFASSHKREGRSPMKAS